MIRVTHLCALIVAIATPFLADPSRAVSPVHVNPQPLPPIHWDGRSTGVNARVNVNPQPLPPFRPGGSKALVNLDPQPLPPRL